MFVLHWTYITVTHLTQLVTHNTDTRIRCSYVLLDATLIAMRNSCVTFPTWLSTLITAFGIGYTRKNVASIRLRVFLTLRNRMLPILSSALWHRCLWRRISRRDGELFELLRNKLARIVFENCLNFAWTPSTRFGAKSANTICSWSVEQDKYHLVALSRQIQPKSLKYSTKTITEFVFGCDK